MAFLKEQLVNNHYWWKSSGVDKSFIGEPSRRLFDRFNGDQVLYLINSLGRVIGSLTTGDGLALEELISKRLPIDMKSELSAYNWLRGAYLSQEDRVVV
jgi:hypothetical protein